MLDPVKVCRKLRHMRTSNLPHQCSILAWALCSERHQIIGYREQQPNVYADVVGK
ncbi:hypothetical protein DPMN_133335 [Dreissena polymorpha]|uniref:Uncharacterized protein n=1 Tax=Dreissena polymorpha TaxID=45954 RepID=A0A9D4JAW0_DREPO|nr:hypothetical protein DPMN_133335 [Dreissena polymorpha]